MVYTLMKILLFLFSSFSEGGGVCVCVCVWGGRGGAGRHNSLGQENGNIFCPYVEPFNKK